ncbi:hypothetical protein [Candidatus Scalindua japonica]|uniref:hypothetical protein n=1 Tax=Candidatus Scalindua japonica TaxID=1284222 RepID=UPI000BDEC474|nr:hypothetical protein [Candidatus Scalindua japonica]
MGYARERKKRVYRSPFPGIIPSLLGELAGISVKYFLQYTESFYDNQSVVTSTLHASYDDSTCPSMEKICICHTQYCGIDFLSVLFILTNMYSRVINCPARNRHGAQSGGLCAPRGPEFKSGSIQPAKRLAGKMARKDIFPIFRQFVE